MPVMPPVNNRLEKLFFNLDNGSRFSFLDKIKKIIPPIKNKPKITAKTIRNLDNGSGRGLKR